MEYHTTQQRMRQRVAQLFLWLLGGRLTRDQYVQRERQRADGVVRSADDPEAFTRQGQQAQQYIQQQERMRRHGR